MGAASDLDSAAEVDETTRLKDETVVIETSVDDDENACLSHAFNIIMDRSIVVAQHSTSILQYSDPSYFGHICPHLLTFGVDGSQARGTI